MIYFIPRKKVKSKNVKSEEQIHRQFNDNSYGSIKTSRSILPHFRARKASQIVLIGGMGCWLGKVSGAVFPASKHVLESAVKLFRKEVAILSVETIIFESCLLNNLPKDWLVRCTFRSMPHLTKL